MVLSVLVEIATVIFLALVEIRGETPAAVFSCRDRSNHLRQDGGLCFEIPPWQLRPVELDKHVDSMRIRWSQPLNESHGQRRNHQVLSNSQISRYMDTVIGPFLDTYHRNIQTAYQQFTSKILKKIKDEINAAVKKKQQIYDELTSLTGQLDVPASCNDERRQSRNLASNYVAQVYACTEGARLAIGKMGKYAEEMITITKNHMQLVETLVDEKIEQKSMKKINISDSLRELSKAAVQLGYELDLSLTNARRHNEQSCEKLSVCLTKAKKASEEAVVDLKDQLYQCVYA